MGVEQIYRQKVRGGSRSPSSSGSPFEGAVSRAGALGSMATVCMLLMALILCSAGTISAAEGSGTAGGSLLGAEPLEIRSIDLRQGSSGQLVDLMATGPVVWTSFRDADGSLIVELPNTRAAEQVRSLHPAEGLVSSVDLESDTRANRPVTRVKIETRRPVEHSLAARGGHLEVRLEPAVDSAAASGRARVPLPAEPHADVSASEPRPEPLRMAALEPLDSEPLDPEPLDPEPLDPEPTPAPNPRDPDPSPTPRPQEPATGGTADSPVVAPPPAGVAASRLDGVELASTDDGTVIRVLGDGEFRYSFFSLDDPARFVIDLEGVVNQSRSSALPVGSATVERVRIAQFKPYPEPVSRVVFDLATEVVPTIERGPDGLVVRFGAGSEPMAAVSADEDLETVDLSDQPVAAVEEETEDTGEVEITTAEGMVDRDVEQVAALEEGSEVGEPQLDPSEREARQQQPREQEPRRVAEPAPRVAQPPASNELEVFEERRQQPEEAEVYEPRIRRERPTAAAAVPEEGDYDVRTLDDTERKYVGEPIDMTVRDADVVEVLRMFAQISGLNIVLQPGITGTVTVELHNVPWDQALEQILRINNLGFELEGNIMRIAPLSQLRQEAEEQRRLEQARALSMPLNTIIKRLSYANASQVAGLLRSQGGMLSQRGSVLVDQRTNTLILKELPEFMDSVIAIIETLDTPEPQVMIEARIVETTKRFSRTLGIAWGITAEASPELGTNTGLEFPNNIDANGQVNLLTGGDNAFIGLSLGNVLNSFVLDAQLQAAENEGLINILSAPKVATLNNERASIQSGLQIPVQTVANNTVTVQFVNATLELSVTPQVTAEGTILMDIDISKREPQLAFAVQGAQNAPISTKEATTRVIVRDGGTTVIGGIYEVSSDQGQDRVPGLANIPIIGHLFRNKRRTDENEELLIFITPRVINL